MLINSNIYNCIYKYLIIVYIFNLFAEMIKIGLHNKQNKKDNSGVILFLKGVGENKSL